MLEKSKLLFARKLMRISTVLTFAVLCMPMAAFASEADNTLDVTQALTTSFQSMANTMLATISATLPVVMSVMSAYLCINYGIRFFKRFTH